MKTVFVIGSGLAGLTCAIRLAEKGLNCKLVSPFPSERSQSVMAAGGINAAIDLEDSIDLHIKETYDGGCQIANLEAIKELCQEAPSIISWLESLGTVFTRNSKDQIALRAFGGQSKNRTAFAGASTGKQIMTALINEARKYEILGLIERKIYRYFHSGLIKNGICYGAMLYNEKYPVVCMDEKPYQLLDDEYSSIETSENNHVRKVDCEICLKTKAGNFCPVSQMGRFAPSL